MPAQSAANAATPGSCLMRFAGDAQDDHTYVNRLRGSVYETAGHATPRSNQAEDRSGASGHCR